MCTPLAAKLEEESTKEQMCPRKELVTSKKPGSTLSTRHTQSGFLRTAAKSISEGQSSMRSLPILTQSLVALVECTYIDISMGVRARI